MTSTHDQIRKAVDLIFQPLLLEVLVGAESGSSPRNAVPSHSDPQQLHAAVRRLTAMGAVEAATSGNSLDAPLALTARGEELVRRLNDLERTALD